ncbi:hypothetical protein HYW76_02525 [Candidatus Pacearchaeota archaeon]|nr:hypothetical protein [Candidatus Pacearchaeota archaeon]
MERLKLSADCEEDLFQKVKEACIIDNRTLANFIRLACLERANKILGVKDERES